MRLFHGMVTSFRARLTALRQAALLSDVALSKMYASGERVTWTDMRKVYREARLAVKRDSDALRRR